MKNRFTLCWDKAWYYLSFECMCINKTVLTIQALPACGKMFLSLTLKVHLIKDFCKQFTKTCKLWTFSSYLNHRDPIQRRKTSYKAFRATFIFQFRYLPHHLPVNLFALIFWSSIWPLLQGYLYQKNKSHHLINQANLPLSPVALKQGEYSKITPWKNHT